MTLLGVTPRRPNAQKVAQYGEYLTGSDTILTWTPAATVTVR